MNEDNAFQFLDDDSSNDKSSEAAIVSALLAGRYYLPPERILLRQTGWGRKIRYEEHTRLWPEWESLPLPSRLAHLYSDISFVTLPRHLTIQSKFMKGYLRVYRYRISEEAMHICSSLRSFALRSMQRDNGVEVSNGGGFHSKPILSPVSMVMMIRI